VIDLRKSGLSRLTIINDAGEVLTRVVLPGDSTVRIGEHEIWMPLGEERVVGPRPTGDYELLPAGAA
jgi:hypothetical protein